MPYLLPVIAEKPDEAIEQARKDTIERAKDIWGLDYADSSEGLFPSGNMIGRSQFRPDQTLANNPAPPVGLPSTNGGQWVTVVSLAGGGAANMVTDANGWGTFFDFIVDEDAFIIIEGMESTDTAPTVREIRHELSGVQLPVFQIEEIYNNGEDVVKGYQEIPVVISPKSQFRERIRSSTVGANIGEGFGIIGETVGKRSHLIQEIY